MPSSIFLSQSIKSFLPSVSSFSFMPCSFPCFYIFFIFFFLVSHFFSYSAFPQCFPIHSSSFIPSLSVFCFSFSIKFPSFLCHHFLISLYNTFAGPYEALKRLKGIISLPNILYEPSGSS